MNRSARFEGLVAGGCHLGTYAQRIGTALARVESKVKCLEKPKLWSAFGGMGDALLFVFVEKDNNSRMFLSCEETFDARTYFLSRRSFITAKLFLLLGCQPTMLLPRLGAPSRVFISAFQRPTTSAESGHELLKHLYPAKKSPLLSFVRHATHKAQGSVNGGKDGAGKRLGAKKSGGESNVTFEPTSCV